LYDSIPYLLNGLFDKEDYKDNEIIISLKFDPLTINNSDKIPVKFSGKKKNILSISQQQIRYYSTPKETRVYKASDSGSVNSFTRSLEDPANDFSVIQALGMDPKHVGIHNMIVRENKPIS